jgi:hypothetical protein
MRIQSFFRQFSTVPPQLSVVLILKSKLDFQKSIQQIGLVVFLFFTVFSATAQPANPSSTLLSPEAFLGYQVGTRYTPHHKVVAYFEHVAQSTPLQVKNLTYGYTYEGRPLMLSFVSSPENISNLENIRKQNLSLAGLQPTSSTSGSSANSSSAKTAIVWLSYNVHGNEPSSSEAAMLTIYSLVSGKQAAGSLAPAFQNPAKWLENTVVVIDPCINPDGRDRYVNWFSSVVGKNAQAHPATREHMEPWPMGRSNHYNFDLNRDWAWQTQQESQLRLKQYNQWMPHIHVDFHEQGFNEPYYFAPAAEPFHEVITPWQRNFQTQIGKNNAKYFDLQGWLYFTRERFDLLYPSYGDTYPTYNGAIGMTYEQGGHSRGGLAVQTEDGDTLTLADRAWHHFTTGMSTIEISSRQAANLLKEFEQFFKVANSSGFGIYKSYIIKNKPEDVERINALQNLLRKNGISFGTATNNASFTGFTYLKGKEEKCTIAEGDLVIPAKQPRSAMVKVLFEPQTQLSDSATYDITAWAIPYAFGVEAYALKETPSFSEATNLKGTLSGNKGSESEMANAYAYAFSWTGVQSASLLGKLLQAGVVARVAQEPFTMSGKDFSRGTIIITKAANRNVSVPLHQLIQKLNTDFLPIYPLSTGFAEKGFDLGSDRVKTIHKKNVVMVTGSSVSSLSAGEIWHFFDHQLDYPLLLVQAEQMGALDLNQVHVLIVPAAYWNQLASKESSESIKQWVRKGGTLIALENTVALMASAEWGIQKKSTEGNGSNAGGAGKEGNSNLYAAVKPYANRERAELAEMTAGAIYKLEIDNTHPLAFGYPNYYYTLKQDGNVYEFFKDNGWNVGVLKNDNYVSGFVGHQLKPKVSDGWIFGVQPMGRGQVVYLNDNPIFRSFWENGKLFICNAVFLVGN